MILTVMAGLFVHPPCLASEDMDALTAAMEEHLKCYPLELLSHEREQLAVTSRDLCLAAVYHYTGLLPLWVTPEGPSPKASVVLDFLINAETEGLDPKNYEIDQIAALFAERRPHSLARLDTLLTFNLIKYIHDVSKGQIKLRDARPVLFSEAGDDDFAPLSSMKKVLAAPDLGAYLASLPPAHRHYRILKGALKTYRELAEAGGWPSIPAGRKIRPGDQDARIPVVAERLSVTGDLDPGVAQAPRHAEYYGPALTHSVARFQRRHGLEPDGVIGPKTLAAMNVSASDAVKQIIINLTRWRWQEHDLGRKYLLVNIANFDLTAFDGGQEAFSFPVIVGKFQHQTPNFSDRIIYLEFNPYWNVPPSIAKNEELPNLRRDRHSLARRHIRLFSSWSPDAAEIRSTSVDWNSISPARMSGFKLRQDPGPWNALGRVKFIFPNHYDVYLHDTPTQNLFSRTQRDFSHGCIRVSDPLGLAAFVLSTAETTWTRDRVDAVIREGKNTVRRLPEPLPVHITYQTSWVDKNGIIYFNRDVYGRDQKLLQALFHK
ncbi:murein L,D-transpeptidase [Desulfococcus sp.]|uniref:L,D-transpeptidase family protein n=1 Tax=Desulfococcus sp. TaxID=2025834 RepID=UPI003592FF53